MEEKILSYAEAAILIDRYLPLSQGKWFEAKDLWTELNVYSADGKHNISQVLSNYRKAGTIEGNRGRYRFADRAFETLDWRSADPNDILDIRWPYGLQDDTSFLFDDNLTLYPGSVVVISGVSNQGKTTFMINLIGRNMDSWKIRYATNEMGKEEFADRLIYLDKYYEWCDDYDQPKFEVGVRYDNYQDIIIPNGFNIIDYLDPGENPYMVGQQIDLIKQRLGRGVAFIALQKKLTTVTTREGTKDVISDYGTGGQYSEHRARIVLHIERDHLYVKKAKKCRMVNLNGKRFSFDIIDNGSQFFNIHEIVKGEG